MITHTGQWLSWANPRPHPLICPPAALCLSTNTDTDGKQEDRFSEETRYRVSTARDAAVGTLTAVCQSRVRSRILSGGGTLWGGGSV